TQISRHATRLAALVESPEELPARRLPRMLIVVDGVTGRELIAPFNPFPDHKDVNSRRATHLTMSADGKRLAVALGAESSVPSPRGSRILDGGTGIKIHRLQIEGAVQEIALTPDGSRLAVDYADRETISVETRSAQSEVGIWDTSTGQLLQTLPKLPSTL